MLNAIIILLIFGTVLDALGIAIFWSGSKRAQDGRDRFTLSILAVRFAVFVAHRLMMIALIGIIELTPEIANSPAMTLWATIYLGLMIISLVSLSIFLGSLVYDQVRAKFTGVKK